MKQHRIISILVLIIALLSVVATLFGIFSNNGPGIYEYVSIRGQSVLIYGEGVYKHMSAELAIQGIAQDFVTLLIGIPVLLISWVYSRKGSIRSRFILSGTLGYFFVTYLFYLVMGMYNFLFLIYVILAGTSFFALLVTLFSFDVKDIAERFNRNRSVKLSGWFLIFNAIIIALLWLSIVIPPLLDGSLYPDTLEHYTTLIVQGLDLAILLPLAFVSGYLLLKNQSIGYLMTTTYFIFLSLMMTALVAKIIYMGIEGYNIIPVIFIMPLFNIIAVICSVTLLKNFNEPKAA